MMDILLYHCSGVSSAYFRFTGRSMELSLLMDWKMGTGELALSCCMAVSPLDGSKNIYDE